MSIKLFNSLFRGSTLKSLLFKFCFFEKGVIGRQQATIFLYSTLLLIGGVILNLCGLAGPPTPFFKIANATQGVFVLLAIYLYYSRRISLKVAMSLFCIVLQVEISVETLYSALHQSTYDMALILANMSLSSILLLLSIISYLRIVPFAIATLSLATYGISVHLTGSDVLADFFVVFIIAFIVFSLLGLSMTRNIARLDQENSSLKDEKQEMLDVFQLSEQEMHSYVTLAQRKDLESNETADILNTVGAVAEKRILDNVAHYVRQSSIEFDQLQERLPELTPSELEICALILKEKKLKQIVELLGKSRSNITCQRSNIRTKLNMQAGDNLYDVLKKRMEEPA